MRPGVAQRDRRQSLQLVWRLECVEFGEERLLIAVMGSIAGERHIDHTVDQVDRGIAQIGLRRSGAAA
jgi:hypothetical protein